MIIQTNDKHIYYQNKSLFEIYAEIVQISKPQYQLLEIKFILKGNIPNITTENQNYCNYQLKNYKWFGKINTTFDIYSKDADYNLLYIWCRNEIQ